MKNTYKCSCGTICTTEWCHKCGIRNTSKFNASQRADTSGWSSNDFTAYTAMNSYSSSSCAVDSASDSGSSCGGGD